MKRARITMANDALAEAMGLPDGVGIATILPDPLAPVSHVIVIFDDEKYDVQDATMKTVSDGHLSFRSLADKSEPCSTTGEPDTTPVAQPTTTPAPKCCCQPVGPDTPEVCDG